MPCTYIQLNYNIYKQFARCKELYHDEMVDKLCEVLPYFKELTKQRKQVILENFEQIKYPDN